MFFGANKLGSQLILILFYIDFCFVFFFRLFVLFSVLQIIDFCICIKYNINTK